MFLPQFFETWRHIMYTYKCSCGYKFTATNTRVKDGKLSDCCQACGMALPKDFKSNKDYIHEFFCINCNKTFPVNELGNLNRVVKFLLAFVWLSNKHFCIRCVPHVSIYYLLMLGILVLLFLVGLPIDRN
jgi:hypothetical protein